jgi:hypothetical protein
MGGIGEAFGSCRIDVLDVSPHKPEPTLVEQFVRASANGQRKNGRRIRRVEVGVPPHAAVGVTRRRQPDSGAPTLVRLFGESWTIELERSGRVILLPLAEGLPRTESRQFVQRIRGKLFDLALNTGSFFWL